MPSLLTARSANEQPSKARSLSRVTSFQRVWDDDQPENMPHGSSQPVDWSSSPPPYGFRCRSLRLATLTLRFLRMPVKVVLPASVSSKTATIDGETPAMRRRKAMMAAMETPSLPIASSSTAAPLPSIPSRSRPAAPQQLPSRTPSLPPLPSLPSLPTLPSLDTRKRQLPWEENVGETKAAKTATTSRTNSNKSTSSGPSLKPLPRILLSNEQQQVLQLVANEGKSIFFTGSAGTGKSVLLREIIKALRKKYTAAPDAVAVTASTGIAACNIGGITLHSFGGVGLGIETPQILVGKIRKNKKAVARWTRTKVLIIDEVSMVDGELFDKLCKIGSMLRKNPKPFGGIQIIVTGDFFQLPPVTKSGASTKFAFEAEMWQETISMSVNLTKVFRQKDQRFVDMLNEMRFGKLTPTSINTFKSLSRPVRYDSGPEATELFPRREDVDRSNNARINALNTEGWSYVAQDGGAIVDPVARAKILSNFMATSHIMIKEQAQVMLIKNVDETLVNGSMGIVIGFCHKPLYTTDTAGRWLPDGIAPGLEVDDELQLARTRAMLESKIQPGTKPFPVVQFSVPGGGKRDMLVEPDTFKNELPNGEVQASRIQLPLILAWAMSIHKSQGQTLERVKVDLGKVFEKGQAYVALSRATSLEGLQITGFSADKVMAHRKVAIWSESLRNLNISN
ncbi:ATP-dependent DNA helicase PIF1, partial [Tremellales sp. Uapishka_1]